MARKSQPQINNKPVTTANQHGVVMVTDAFQNPLARLGYGTPNLMEGTQYPLTRLTRDYQLMNSLYRNNWLAQRVIDTPVKDMLKNWIKYTSEITPEEIDMFERTERISLLRNKLERGLCWGRLYGGAAGLMVIDGQEDLEQPLDLDAISPGDFKTLMVVDRWSGVYPQLELVDDINDREFGLPRYYQFQNWVHHEQFRVHHSRIIRFTGSELPEWERMAEVYWGASIIESVYEELKKRDNTSANIAMLIFQSRLLFYKMKGLSGLINGTNTAALEMMFGTMQLQNWLRSNFSTNYIGNEDEIEQFEMGSLAGLNDIYESFMLDMSGATQIPVTKLFGRSPAGMNATGESDMRNYYGFIEQEQEAKLRPALEKLLPVLCMSTLGYIPDDIDFEFNPVETPTEEKLGEIVKSKGEAIRSAYDSGIITQRMALMEYKQLSESTGMFTNITDEDIAAASNELHDPMDLMGEPEAPGEPKAKEED